MNKTFNLFLISVLIILLTIIVATFWDYLHLGNNTTPLALSVTIAFGISIAGLILGIPEIRKNKTAKSVVGIVGHILVVLFFLGIVGYSMAL
ncbi:hypothetical protein DF185_03400 [Marinifilum breve]|uniref:Uncharacterized protein n=1 Tax=Marinifilum breve TaxID=2184082 RepID=A0A2V4AGA4_9BACT|nr:hypothetical protein [Marinifilum breve]PXY03144.1 hypothetical protein DF185_03400 [Marinifilum breve]